MNSQNLRKVSEIKYIFTIPQPTKKKEKTLFKKEKKQRTKLDQSKGVHTGEEKPNWMLNNSLSKQAYLNFKKKNFSFIDTP